ncbi:hypothetical protein CEXT_448031 [Caerostris extrusa]|uniref:Uncharacterized protein n=1 Tax=Caerostris extrusa TaxID=172846 RepID=A0AAV4QMI1_CAEEX|nr:hypothetical protein CEXT_448031 [Caerostris extrusa]
MYPGLPPTTTRRKKDIELENGQTKVPNSKENKEFLREEWERNRNMGITDSYMTFDEYGRRDIYSNYDKNNQSKTKFDTAYSSPKPFVIKRSYDNAHYDKQVKGNQTKPVISLLS